LKSPLIFRIFKSGQLVGVKQFDLPQVVIGNNADVQLNLESEEVSPIHCLIESRDNGYFICDLGSQSGTFKNGQAILDEMISSGDEIEIGPFHIVFFIGVPKPKAIPGVVDTSAQSPKPDTVVASPILPPPPSTNPASPAAETPAPFVAPAAAPPPPPPATKPEETPVVLTAMPPANVAKVEEIQAVPVIPAVIPAVIPTAVPETPSIPKQVPTQAVPPAPTPKQTPPPAAKAEEKPAIVAAPMRPEIKRPASPYKKEKRRKTFAPPSEIEDLRSYLKPGKGNTLEVIVAWKERVLTTYHFKGRENLKVGSGKKNQIALPDGLVPRGYVLIDRQNGIRVNATEETKVELFTDNTSQTLEQLTSTGKSQKIASGNSVRLEQGEMVCLTLPGGNIILYVRFVADPPVVPIIPLMLSGSELTGLVMSLVIVSILALYISATTPKDWEENKQDDVQHVAQIIFNKPSPTPKPSVAPTPPPPPVAVATPPPPPKATPPPPKKVVVTDMTKDEHKKAPTEKKAVTAQTAARAAEVAPKENKNLPKKFTSTRQGGAVKTGDTASANAQSANKDISKVGLFSAFGGGGNRAKIDQAYSGSGEVLGMADKATGTSGQNENRAGDDLGSKIKDTGAGGKGTATQGIAGVGTKGRSNGQSNYGATEGFGAKSAVAIEGGGFDEAFDGTIDKDAIRRVIRAKLHEVKSCYERALNTLEKGHKLEGKIVLGWEIVEKGQARNVKVKSSTLGNAQVENCIRDHLASWTFPEPPPGLVAEVQAYPFVLNQSN